MEQEQQQLPNSTLILVLGILSIVSCCCYGIPGLILGIITIVLVKKATAVYAKNPENYTGFQNVKTGKILAIIGLILSFLFLIYILWMLSMIGWDALGDPELMMERAQEMQNQ